MAVDRLAKNDVRQRRALQRLSGSGRALTPVFNDTITGTVDGQNATFKLTAAPVGQSLMLFKNGLLQRPGAGNDYQLSGSTITFEPGNIPQTGDVLMAFYQKR